MLVVSPLSENVTQTVLGDYDSRTAEGVGVDAYLVRETGDDPREIAGHGARGQVLARASIAIARRPLHRAGYHLVEYGGADALTPGVSGGAGLYIRRLTATGEHRVSSRSPQTPSLLSPVLGRSGARTQ